MRPGAAASLARVVPPRAGARAEAERRRAGARVARLHRRRPVGREPPHRLRRRREAAIRRLGAVAVGRPAVAVHGLALARQRRLEHAAAQERLAEAVQRPRLSRDRVDRAVHLIGRRAQRLRRRRVGARRRRGWRYSRREDGVRRLLLLILVFFVVAARLPLIGEERHRFEPGVFVRVLEGGVSGCGSAFQDCSLEVSLTHDSASSRLEQDSLVTSTRAASRVLALGLRSATPGEILTQPK